MSRGDYTAMVAGLQSWREAGKKMPHIAGNGGELGGKKHEEYPNKMHDCFAIFAYIITERAEGYKFSGEKVWK